MNGLLGQFSSCISVSSLPILGFNRIDRVTDDRPLTCQPPGVNLMTLVAHQPTAAAVREARQRRAEWDNEKHPLAEPLHYRWGNVKRMLMDLEDHD